jgi:hypothetical protein
MKSCDCRHCIHYFITWDKLQPHGCKAFGFKSHDIPSKVVAQNSSGKPCQLFIKKQTSSVSVATNPSR